MATGLIGGCSICPSARAGSSEWWWTWRTAARRSVVSVHYQTLKKSKGRVD